MRTSQGTPAATEEAEAPTSEDATGEVGAVGAVDSQVDGWFCRLTTVDWLGN